MQSNAEEISQKARALLREELARRIRANPRYSLRAWARALGISHSLLSLILSGKRAPSKKTIQKLAQVMGLSPGQTHHLFQNTSDFAPRPRGRGITEEEYRSIGVDTFALLADWYHYAILSLLDIPGARFESKWIARQLGITEIQARLAMDRLLRLKLVEREGKNWKQSGRSLKVENTVSTPATRHYHRQVLQKAIDSLENDPMSVRDFSGMTFTMDPKSIPHALGRIREFRRSLMAELQAMGKPSTVYNLNVQIFPISRYQENT